MRAHTHTRTYIDMVVQPHIHKIDEHIIQLGFLPFLFLTYHYSLIN